MRFDRLLASDPGIKHFEAVLSLSPFSFSRRRSRSRQFSGFALNTSIVAHYFRLRPANLKNGAAAYFRDATPTATETVVPLQIERAGRQPGGEKA